MSNPPADLLDLRAKFAAETGCPLKDIGIAADPSHLSSGGYHCGAEDLKAIDGVGRDDYSIRQTRDRAVYWHDVANGINFSSAMDFPDDWPRGGRAAWIRWNNLVRAQLGARDPALAAIRGMNFTPDGTMKRRFDCLTGKETSSTDTVTWHTHIEWWRDTLDQPQRRWATTRIIAMVIAARDGTPLDAPSMPAPTPSIGENDVIYQVTSVPTGATDVTGAVVPENGQCVATPNGPFNYTGSEFFSLPASAQAVRIVMTWARLLKLCEAMAQPLALSGDQLGQVTDAAASGARYGINGATISAPAPTPR